MNFFVSNQRRRNKGKNDISQARRYVLLDRDGTLNVEKNYLSDPSEVELLPGSVEGLRLLQSHGFGMIIVTNQSGVGRGYFDTVRLESINSRLRGLLLQHGVTIDGTYCCPHSPDENCLCRKPRPGLVYQAAAELHFDPCESIVIGDKSCDIEMGRRVGAATVLLIGTADGAKRRKDSERPDLVVRNLVEAATLILQFVRQPCG